MIKATLVLEGGANRGVFTSGVLDYLMGKELYMSNVIGVSAGACNAVDYVSKQAREFDTLKSKKVPQSLEIGLFFCQIFIFII